ncbi:MAG: hypothetical protein IKS55_11570 [Oscillospiraceae bacterium]|nr:hypothetical protein [Oscillospiraceae bacterium]
MKYAKRILAVLLVLVLVFGLSGCTAFETKMAKAANKMKKVDNFRSDVSMVMALDMNMLGMSLMDMAMEITGTLDIDKDHGVMKGDLHLDMMDEKSDVLLYVEQDGDLVRTYSSNDGGETWTLKEQPLDGENSAGFTGLFDIGGITDLDKDKLQQLKAIAETFEEIGTEEVKGSEATLYRGKLSMNDVQDRTALVMLLDQLNEQMGTELTEEDLAGISDMPVIIGIDNQSGLITRLAFDMTDMMQSVVGIAMEIYLTQMMEAEGSADVGIDAATLRMMKINVSECSLVADLYDFNAVGDVVIPDSVRSSAVPVDSLPAAS